MQLNKKKSGIVSFVDRPSHDVLNIMRTKENGKSKLILSKAEIEGVPIRRDVAVAPKSMH